MFAFLRHAAHQKPKVLSRTFSRGASKGGVGISRRMSGSRPSTVALLCALNIGELAVKNKKLFSASPSRVGDMDNPICFPINGSPPSSTLSAVHMFSTSGEAAAGAEMQQQHQYTYICLLPYLLHQAL